jgi:hypothetical protein
MAYNLNNLKKIAFALNEAGATGKEFVFLLCQVGHETGDFASNVFLTHTNASGITWANKPYQLNATKGEPLKENSKYNYARFKTLKDWAVDFRRITRKSTTKAGSLAEYAALLKQQKYYTDPVSVYANGLQNAFKKLSVIYTKLTGNAFVLPKSTTTTPVVDEKKKNNLSKMNPIFLFGMIGLFIYFYKK